MKVNFIAHPAQLGGVLPSLLDDHPKPSRVVFASAFVSLQAVMRLKDSVLGAQDGGAQVRLVVGIDSGGTSSEVLQEVLSWGIDVRIVKHRDSGHMFHPKLYLFEWADRRIVIVGSNNLTDGGLFRNYEGAVQVTYSVPEDNDEYRTATGALERFLKPSGPTSYVLTQEWLEQAVKGGHIPTEKEAREQRQVSEQASSRLSGGKPLELGTEEFGLPPPLPAHLLDRLLTDVRAKRRAARRAAGTGKTAPPTTAPGGLQAPTVPLAASAFYMTLPKLQGKNIPGEARVPLGAVELAQEFWGWPDEYSKDVSPQGGQQRVYWNWRPQWIILTAGASTSEPPRTVRMYMYENSSDFRFYAGPLVNAGADEGDVVRIRRIAQTDAEYECVLAKRNTPEWRRWLTRCTQTVQNSNRRFGYA